MGQAGESLRGQNGTEGCVVSGRTSLTTDMRQTQNSEKQNRREEMKKINKKQSHRQSNPRETPLDIFNNANS